MGQDTRVYEDWKVIFSIYIVLIWIHGPVLRGLAKIDVTAAIYNLLWYPRYSLRGTRQSARNSAPEAPIKKMKETRWPYF